MDKTRNYYDKIGWMKKKIFINIFFLIFVSLLTFFSLKFLVRLYVENKIDRLDELESSESAEEKFIEVNSFFVPITALNSSLENFQINELTDRKIWILQDDRNILESRFGLNLSLSSLENMEVMKEKLYENTSNIGLIRVENSDYRFKTLKIEGNDFWDENYNLQDYPFTIIEEKSISELEEKEEFNREKTFKITETGEIILARGVAERIEKYQDVFYPFTKTQEILEKADLTISTLEAPIYSDCIYCDSCMVFCGKPEYLEGLSFAGIDAVSMAANHIKDFGTVAIEETIAELEKREIKYFGAGVNISEARKPFMKTVKGKKIGFLAYNDVVPETYAATEFEAGSAWAEIENIEEDIVKLQSEADLIVVMMHWGVEYTNFPSERQIELAHGAIEAGADLIIGDHPHVVQGIEFYKNKFIIYGVGNYVFDQMWSQETREGVILDFTFYDEKILNIRFQGIVLEDWAQPRLANQEEEIIILNRIWEASKF